MGREISKWGGGPSSERKKGKGVSSSVPPLFQGWTRTNGHLQDRPCKFSSIALPPPLALSEGLDSIKSDGSKTDKVDLSPSIEAFVCFIRHSVRRGTAAINMSGRVFASSDRRDRDPCPQASKVKILATDLGCADKWNIESKSDMPKTESKTVPRIH